MVTWYQETTAPSKFVAYSFKIDGWFPSTMRRTTLKRGIHYRVYQGDAMHCSSIVSSHVVSLSTRQTSPSTRNAINTTFSRLRVLKCSIIELVEQRTSLMMDRIPLRPVRVIFLFPSDRPHIFHLIMSANPVRNPNS